MTITQEIQTIISNLDNLDPEIREEAALKLAKIASENVVEPLLNHLNDPVPEVREMVIHALGKTKSNRVIPDLVECLKDASLNVRWVAVEALGEIASEKTIAPLMTCLENEEVWNVRASAIQSLAKSGSTLAIPLLKKLLQDDENSFVRHEAWLALVSLTSDRSVWLGAMGENLLGAMGENLLGAMVENLKHLYENLFRGDWEPVPVPRNNRNNRNNRNEDNSIKRIKKIELGADRSVMLFVELTPESEEQVKVLVRISPAENARELPLGLTVEAMDRSGKLILEEVVIVTETDLNQDIEIELNIRPGNHFQIKLTLQDISCTEEI